MDSGKVKAIGMSEYSAADIKKVHDIVPVSVIELEWSIFERESEVSLLLHFIKPFGRLNNQNSL